MLPGNQLDLGTRSCSKSHKERSTTSKARVCLHGLDERPRGYQCGVLALAEDDVRQVDFKSGSLREQQPLR